MNKDMKKESIEDQPQKSKRLSSLIWILVIWSVARIFSELNGLGWERTFYWGAPIYLGAFPVSAFLLLSIATNDLALVTHFRNAALFIFLVCVTIPWAIPNISRTQGLIFQALLFIGLSIWIFIAASRKREKKDKNV